jgi:hypothetical protein
MRKHLSYRFKSMELLKKEANSMLAESGLMNFSNCESELLEWKKLKLVID